MRVFKPLLAIAMVGAVAGCVIESPQPRQPARPTLPPQPTGVEGNWQNTQGLYNATFNNGQTVWVDTQTGATLVRGNYSRTNQTDYALTLTSEVSGKTLQANCRLFTVNQLNCSREDGNQFSMVRLAS